MNCIGTSEETLRRRRKTNRMQRVFQLFCRATANILKLIWARSHKNLSLHINYNMHMKFLSFFPRSLSLCLSFGFLSFALIISVEFFHMVKKRNDVPYVFQCLLNIQLYATAIVYSDLWHNFRTAKGKLTQNIFHFSWDIWRCIYW